MLSLSLSLLGFFSSSPKLGFLLFRVSISSAMEMEIFCRNGGVGLERMVASVMEALVVETALVAEKSVMWLLLAVWISILILVSDSVSYFFLSLFFQIIIWVQLYRCCYDVGWVGLGFYYYLNLGF